MGREARCRGSFEERKAKAIEEGRTKVPGINKNRLIQETQQEILTGDFLTDLIRLVDMSKK